MSSPRRHEFPPETPTSLRRLKRESPPPAPSAPPKPPRCRWTGCTKEAVREVPLCWLHAYEATDFVLRRDPRFTESREEALARTRHEDRVAKRRMRREQREQRLRESRGSQPGWIYYLQVGDQVKIGYTTDIVERIRSYPPGSPLLAVHPGTPDLERELHSKFRGSLVRGREWFRPDPFLLDHCQQARDEYGDPGRYEYHARSPHSSQQVTYPKAWRGKARG